MKQPIQMYAIKSIPGRSWIIPEVKWYNPQGKMRWLQRIACSILRKYGVDVYQHDPETFEKVVIDFGNMSLREKVRNAQYELLISGYHQNMEYILMGSDVLTEFKDMLRSMNISDYIDTFLGTELRIMGMRIIYVPWMKGMLMLPKDLIK